MPQLTVNTLKHSIVLIFLSGLVNIVYADSVFRWVDAAGHVHYSDRPPQETAKEVQEKHITQSMIQTSGDSYAMQIASRKFPATFYTSGDCTEVCAKAKLLLDQRNIPYTTVDANSESSQLMKITGNTKVPVLTLGSSTVIRGWEESRWVSALDEAGYPKHVIKSSTPTNKLAKIPNTPNTTNTPPPNITSPMTNTNTPAVNTTLFKNPPKAPH
jgi:glutaredoxin